MLIFIYLNLLSSAKRSTLPAEMGSDTEVRRFNETLTMLPYTHKIVIAGNHEMSFDRGCKKKGRNATAEPTDPRMLLNDCTYLEDSAVEVR